MLEIIAGSRLRPVQCCSVEPVARWVEPQAQRYTSCNCGLPFAAVSMNLCFYQNPPSPTNMTTLPSP